MRRAHETCPYSRATRGNMTSHSAWLVRLSSVRQPELLWRRVLAERRQVLSLRRNGYSRASARLSRGGWPPGRVRPA
jgi:hypothetical protein